jgi:hypothetical protein
MMRAAASIRRLFVAAPLIVCACTTSADVETTTKTANMIAAAHDVQVCRGTIAAKPGYQALAKHMPLATPYSTTLLQMTDAAFASDDDIVTLGLWLDDIRKCREQIVDAAVRGFPTSLAVIVDRWNKDDEAFVLLATRKLPWGKMVLKLRTNHAEMLDAIARQELQLSQQLSSERQAELSRRVALFNALTNLVP